MNEGGEGLGERKKREIKAERGKELEGDRNKNEKKTE